MRPAMTDRMASCSCDGDADGRTTPFTPASKPQRTTFRESCGAMRSILVSGCERRSCWRSARLLAVASFKCRISRSALPAANSWRTSVRPTAQSTEALGYCIAIAIRTPACITGYRLRIMMRNGLGAPCSARCMGGACLWVSALIIRVASARVLAITVVTVAVQSQFWRVCVLIQINCCV